MGLLSFLRKKIAKKVEIVPGKKMKVVGNKAHHFVPIGTVVTVTHVNPAAYQKGGYVYTREYAANKIFYRDDLAEYAYKRNDLLKEADKHLALAFQARAKADYLQETGKEEVEGKAWRKHQVKKLMEDQNLNEQSRTDRINALFLEE